MKGTCRVCKQKKKNVHEDRKLGKIICPSCRRNDRSTHEKCSTCGKRKPVEKRSKSGEPICPRCYKNAKVGKCAKCKKKKIIAARGLCRACYQRQRRTRLKR